MQEEDIRGAVLQEADRHGVPLSPDRLDGLVSFVRGLGAWGRRHRIVGHADLKDLVAVHVSDSLAWVHAVRDVTGGGSTPMSAVDVGTGAGLPGLVAAMAWPRLQVTLCEVNEKRVAFLYWIIQKTAPTAQPFAGPVERLIGEGRSFLHVVSRAFRPPLRWIEMGAALARSDGWVWMLLTADQAQEPSLGRYLRRGSVYRYELGDGRARVVLGVPAPLLRPR